VVAQRLTPIAEEMFERKGFPVEVTLSWFCRHVLSSRRRWRLSFQVEGLPEVKSRRPEGRKGGCWVQLMMGA
jgi:hypothetical protein